MKPVSKTCMTPFTGYSRKGESMGTENKPGVTWAGGDHKDTGGRLRAEGTVLYLDDCRADVTT